MYIPQVLSWNTYIPLKEDEPFSQDHISLYLSLTFLTHDKEQVPMNVSTADINENRVRRTDTSCNHVCIIIAMSIFE